MRLQRAAPVPKFRAFQKIKLQPLYTYEDQQDSAVIGSTTVVSGDVAAFADAATVGSVTTIVGSYLTETFTLHTTYYDWTAWTVTVTSGGYPTVGSVGGFDNDHGQIT